MSTYYLAKARQDQLLREAAQTRLIRAAKRAKKAGKQKHSQAKGWVNRRLHATRA